MAHHTLLSMPFFSMIGVTNSSLGETPATIEPAHWTESVIPTPVSLFLFTLTVITTKSAFRMIWDWAQGRINAYRFLFYGPAMIQEAFDRAGGKPFDVSAPDTRHVFVSSEQHIGELDKANDFHMSMLAASKKVIQPVYTMHGWNWHDSRAVEGHGFVRAVRVLLTNNLSNLLPSLSDVVKSRLEQEFTESLSADADDSANIAIFSTMTKLVVHANAVSVFGPELAKNEDFLNTILIFIEETLACAELIRLLPAFLSPVIGTLFNLYFKSHQNMFSTLFAVVENRCREKDLASGKMEQGPEHLDCIQWIIESSPKKAPWTAKRITQELIAIWLGSVHALSTTTTFAIHDLCLHPEYLPPLRREATAHYAAFEGGASSSSIASGKQVSHHHHNQLPLLDSFLKESARLTPVDSQSSRRCATQPFTFADGVTKLFPGDWACTPVAAMMRREADYPRAGDFSGFRFVAREELVGGLEVGGEKEMMEKKKPMQPRPSKLVDTDPSWQVWGTGRMACPGRYYATAVMKVILSHIIMNYDVKLADPDAPRSFTWRSSTLPRGDTKVVFTIRDSRHSET